MISDEKFRTEAERTIKEHQRYNKNNIPIELVIDKEEMKYPLRTITQNGDPVVKLSYHEDTLPKVEKNAEINF